MNKAVGYIRVSTSGQAKQDKLSLENQESKIRKYCQSEEFELVKVYKDTITGAKDDRPGLQALLLAARNKEFNHVIINDLTRFGRSAKDLLVNTEKLEKLDIAFHSVKDKIDCSTRQGKFFFQILSAIAELELETIKVRLGEVKLVKMRRKEIFPGNPPYCYTWNDDTKSITTVEKQVEVYHRIVTDYVKRKMSMTEIARQLNIEHVPTWQKGKRWTTVVVSSILRKPVYCSTQFPYHLKEETIFYDLEPIITKSKWEKIQRQTELSKTKSGRPTKASDTFLLYGQLRCGLCSTGTRLSTGYGSKKRNDGTAQRYYFCTYHRMTTKRLAGRGKGKCELPRIDAENIENSVWNYLRTFFFYMDEKVTDATTDKWKPKLEQAEQKVRNIQNEKSRLKIGRANTESLRFEENFPRAIYVSQVTELTQQIQQINLELKEAESELADTKQMIQDEQEMVDFATQNPDIFEQILTCIENLPFAGKQKLLRGMLVEPIKVFSTTAYIPIFNFNSLILQEILSEYCPTINSKYHVHDARRLRAPAGLP